jgi:hypothetical protein
MRNICYTIARTEKEKESKISVASLAACVIVMT